MCKDSGCLKKDSCLRFKGKPNKHRQSYFIGSPMKDGKCDFYWEIKEDTPLTEKEEYKQFLEVLPEILKDL